jgi:hypothetical protein
MIAVRKTLEVRDLAQKEHSTSSLKIWLFAELMSSTTYFEGLWGLTVGDCNREGFEYSRDKILTILVLLFRMEHYWNS